MKKLLFLTIALLAFNFSNAQGSLTLDSLYRNDNLTITTTPNTALGTGGVVAINGNALAGRITITTGTGSYGHTVCNVYFPSTTFTTDDLLIDIWSTDGKFFQVVAQGVQANYFDIYSKDLWEDNMTYEFAYTIVAKVQ